MREWTSSPTCASASNKPIAEEPPAVATDPGVIRAGYHAELDELRDLSQHSSQIIAAMEERERKRTGIGSLKIRYNQVFGFYIEISKPNLHLAPPDYERKQTLVNAERFTTPELKEYERKVLAADERIAEIERQLFVDVRSCIAAQSLAPAPHRRGHRPTRRPRLFRQARRRPQLRSPGIHRHRRTRSSSAAAIP